MITFNEFMAQSTPKAGWIDSLTLRAAAVAAGLKVETATDGRLSAVDSWTVRMGPNTDLRIVWWANLEGNTLRVSPQFDGYYAPPSQAVERIMNKIGLVERIIPLPEIVVELPIPSWVGAQDQDGWDAMAHSRQIFKSEISAYKAEILAVFDKLES